MNHSNDPLDPDLSLFEQDLRSLTPTRLSSSPRIVDSQPVLSNHLVLPTSSTEVRKQMMDEPLTALSQRRWLSAVAVAWATGLAAGLLIAAMWREENNEISNSSTRELASTDVATQRAAPKPKDAADANSIADRSERVDGSQSTESVSAQRKEPSLEPFSTWNRYISFGTSRERILHPLTPIHQIQLDGRATPFSSSYGQSREEVSANSEPTHAPNLPSSDAIQSGAPELRQPTGQRELLNRLIAEDGFIAA